MRLFSSTEDFKVEAQRRGVPFLDKGNYNREEVTRDPRQAEI